MCAQINPSLPTLGGARGDGETNLRADVVAILNELNGNLDSSNIKDGTLRTADLDSAGTVTALPTGYDGQEINYLADATNGIVWQLKYRLASAAASKWEIVGGSALAVEVLPNETTTSTTYVDLTTVGPQITVPLAGDYEIEFEAQISSNVTGSDVRTAVKLGAAATVDADGIASAASGLSGTTAYRSIRRTLAANTVVKMQYRIASNVGGWANRRLRIRPVRVG